MSVSASINLRDLTTRELVLLERALEPGQLALVGARGAANLLKDHFRELETSHPNKKGWPRQHFWAAARKGVQTPVQRGTNAAVVSINKDGVALLYFGGVVRPILAEMLTIPAVAEAYGKRARERSDLILAKRVNPETGKLQLCLIQAEQTKVILGPRSKKTGQRRLKRSESAGGKVIYWLAAKVRIPKDPSVLPTPQALEQAAGKAVDSTLERIVSRAGNG